MTKINAESFNDYIEQSFCQNPGFVDEVEAEIQERIPGGLASVELDGETKVIDYDREEGKVTLLLTWTGNFEESELGISGTTTISAKFFGRGEAPARLEFHQLLDYTDDFSE